MLYFLLHLQQVFVNSYPLISSSEYYFSAQNLERDTFMRRRMDSEGYVPLSIIATFKRVQALTQDFAFISQAMKESEVVQIVDGIKVRNFFSFFCPSLKRLQIITMSYMQQR